MTVSIKVIVSEIQNDITGFTIDIRNDAMLLEVLLNAFCQILATFGQFQGFLQLLRCVGQFMLGSCMVKKRIATFKGLKSLLNNF